MWVKHKTIARPCALLLALFVTCLLALPAHAQCTKSRALHTSSYRSAQIWFGKITVLSKFLQPSGTLLASTVVPPTAFPGSDSTGASANTILWTCEASTLPQLHFLVATNGKERLNGHNDVGAADGLSHLYATWFNRIGLRLTMDGIPVARTWQKVALKDYDRITTRGKAMIAIRLKHVPSLAAELYTFSTPILNAGGNGCGRAREPNLNDTGAGYTCSRPHAYIQLVGPGLPHDHAGDDSNTHRVAVGGDNGFAYTMGATLYKQASCAIRNTTPHITFPAVSLMQLLAGQTVSAPFSVQMECDDYTRSGTNYAGQVSMGIQVSPGAWQAAEALRLITPRGGVRALVSDQYEQDPALATGVGIMLHTARGVRRLFVGQADRRDGWYPVLEGARRIGPSVAYHALYQHDFKAVLQRLPGEAMTAGRVHATATVLVKVN